MEHPVCGIFQIQEDKVYFCQENICKEDSVDSLEADSHSSGHSSLAPEAWDQEVIICSKHKGQQKIMKEMWILRVLSSELMLQILT